jgi:hypothetical protein
MTFDDALRQDLIAASRRCALENRKRLSDAFGWRPPMAFAAMLLFAAGISARRPLRMLVLAGGAWLAYRWLGGQQPVGLFEGADDTDSAPELVGSPIDQSSSESFPASDPPARSRCILVGQHP